MVKPGDPVYDGTVLHYAWTEERTYCKLLHWNMKHLYVPNEAVICPWCLKGNDSVQASLDH